MILFLSKFQKPASLVLLTALTMGILPLDVMAGKTEFSLLGEKEKPSQSYIIDWHSISRNLKNTGQAIDKKEPLTVDQTEKELIYNSNLSLEEEDDTGGPSQPEMATFKSISTDNMVDLFTGNFSYNIPLLDVGGYPVNIFYSGDIGMDQDASWVGLGWNINPGTITRNMRGVPDDFDGSEEQVQEQNVKPNITWGVTASYTAEVLGLKNMLKGAETGTDGATGGTTTTPSTPGGSGTETKAPLPKLQFNVSTSLGISFNNKLGPALEKTIGGGMTYKFGENMLDKNSKNSFAARFGANGNLGLSSRDGLSFSPSASLGASISNKVNNLSWGIGTGASTSINSAVGVKSIQLSGQVSFNESLENFFGADKNDSRGSSHASPYTISFAKPSYLPVIKNPITHSNTVGQMQLGLAYWGIEGTATLLLYKQKSEIKSEDMTVHKPMLGMLYNEKATYDDRYIMDYTRTNDNEVLRETPVISVPQYTYDVFNISGEGVGGNVRLFRSDIGFMRETVSESKNKSASIGLEASPPGQYGGNVSLTKTPSRVSGWSAGNLLRHSTAFKTNEGLVENSYFRNPGENTVLLENQYAGIGNDKLVRYKLGGDEVNPVIRPLLEQFSEQGMSLPDVGISKNADRRKRTQVVSYLTAEEASKIGLETKIVSHELNTGYNGGSNDLLSKTIMERVGAGVESYRKKNHISQVNVLETNGSLYVYGLPVYNIEQEELVFSTTGNDDTEAGLSLANVGEMHKNSALMANISDRDGYFQRTKTPGYAHSYLLTGLLSPDYVDVTSDGITDDDLGNAVKFNYKRVEKVGNNWNDYLWRTPSYDNRVNFLPGKLADDRDDKGMIVTGKRESWYLQSVESKSMIAIFHTSDRDDINGFTKNAGDDGYILKTNDKSIQKLDRIDLYNKSDLAKNGLSKARPVKSVNFEYSYELCPSYATSSSTSGNKGKLTLKKIYFTYNGVTRSSKEQYVFGYGNTSGVSEDNPGYQLNVSDRWGTYKGSNANGMKNRDYPYTSQGRTQSEKASLDKKAGAWSLKKILLPSGGQIEVDYEIDDYAYVQNRRAMDMMEVYGFGSGPDHVNYSSSLKRSYLYERVAGTSIQYDHLFVKLPASVNTRDEFIASYLDGVKQLSVKMAIVVKGNIKEYIPTYAEIVVDNADKKPECGIKDISGVGKVGWIRVKKVNGYSPFTVSALEFLRLQLPKYAYPGYDLSDGSALDKVGGILVGMLSGLDRLFDSPMNYFIEENKLREVIPAESFVRLNNPYWRKFGGGSRVKEVRIRDNWNNMTDKGPGGQFTSVYGQKYSYTTKELINGVEKEISSGVANYEPAIGNDENPFLSILTIEDKLPLGPTTYGAIEFPLLDGFFPAPVVGYSKVTVESIGKHPTEADIKSKVGKQVSEFYTAREFPYYSEYTKLDPKSDKSISTSSKFNFFVRRTFERRTISQGFLVRINDMHGKQKSQQSYSASDMKTAITETRYHYKNTGKNGMNDKVNFIYANEGGKIRSGNIGIDIELMTDTREYSVNVNGKDFEGQMMFFTFFPVGTLFPITSNSVNKYNEITCTKTVSYRSILDKIEVRNYGSTISTENLLYDSETGSVVVSKLNNEYGQPVYNVNYPAYWGYGDMSGAYKNIGAIYKGVNFVNGKIDNASPLQNVVHSGDELYIVNGTATNDCMDFANTHKIWAISDDHLTFTNTASPLPKFVFVDKDGVIYNGNNVTVKIVRSGYRNLLDGSVGSVELMENPIKTDGGITKLVINSSSKVLNAGAIEYKQRWLADNSVVGQYSYVPYYCDSIRVKVCKNGNLEQQMNPYTKGLIGNYRANKKYVYYSERNNETIGDRRSAGLFSEFKLMWNFDDSDSKFKQDLSNAKWVWQTESTKFNKRGFELENINALGIYSSALYGYNKILPVATASNTKYNELWYEGFEDGGFKSQVNHTGNEVCNDVALDLNIEQSNTSSLVNNVSHTGRSSLMVNAGEVLNVPLKFNTQTPNSAAKFNVDGTKTNRYAPYHLGMQYGTVASQSHAGGSPTTLNENGRLYSKFKIQGDPSNNMYKSLIDNYKFYVEIKECRNYSFDLSAYHDYLEDDKGSNPFIRFRQDVFIKNVATNVVEHSLSVGEWYLDAWGSSYQNVDTTKHYDVELNRGMYEIIVELDFFAGHSFSTTYPYMNGYYIFNSDLPYPFYYSADKRLSCVASEPLKSLTPGVLLNGILEIPKDKRMVISGWVKEDCGNSATGVPCGKTTFNDGYLSLNIPNGIFKASGPIIEGWQRIEGVFTVPASTTSLQLSFNNSSGGNVYFDDLRIHPYNGNMKSYVYDPVNLRLVAELDANNFSKYYEYDGEGTLIRTKAETVEGIKTINETRSSKQKVINAIQ